MASESSEGISELKSNFLLCSFCLEEYRKPRTLDCLHSFCEECLGQYVSKRGIVAGQDLPCPLCRTNTTLPAGGITALRINFVLHGLADFIKVRSKTSTEATWERLQSSMLKEYENLQSDKGSNTLPVCESHGKKCKLFCLNECCNVALCSKCFPAHSGHSMASVEEHTKAQKQALLNSQSILHDHIEKLNLRLNTAELKLKTITMTEKEVHSQVNQRLDEIIKTAASMAGLLIEKFSKTFRQEEAEIQKQKFTLQEDLKALQHTSEVVDQVLKFGSMSDLMSTGMLASERTEQLLQKLKGNDTHEKALPLPSYVAPDTNVHIQHLKEMLGEIITNPTDNPATQERNGPIEQGAMGSSNIESQTESHVQCGIKQTSVHLENIPKQTRVVNTIYIRDVQEKQPMCSGLCFGPDEELVVVDGNNRNLKMFNLQGELRWVTKYKFRESPWGIVWSQNHNAYLLAVCDVGFYTVDRKGWMRKAANIMKSIVSPYSAVVRQSGIVALGEHGGSQCKISLWDTEGRECLRSWLVKHDTFYFTATEHMIIMSSIRDHKVRAYSNKGKNLWKFGMMGCGATPTQLNEPCGLCIDRSGKIIVCDSGNNRLLVLTSGGKWVWHIPCCDKPEDIAMSNSGHLAVWNRGSKTISIWEYHD